MPRKKEDKIRFSTIIDKDVNDKLHEYSEQSGIPIAFIVNKALKEHLKIGERSPKAKGAGENNA